MADRKICHGCVHFTDTPVVSRHIPTVEYEYGSGQCLRYPRWERKERTTLACGEYEPEQDEDHDDDS